MWGYMMNGGGHWGGGMFMISHVLWWVFIVFVVFAIFRWRRTDNSNGTTGQKEDSAMRILRERYARGEIDKADFEERKLDLKI